MNQRILYFKNEKYAKIEDNKAIYFSFFLLYVDSTWVICLFYLIFTTIYGSHMSHLCKSFTYFI